MYFTTIDHGQITVAGNGYCHVPGNGYCVTWQEMVTVSRESRQHCWWFGSYASGMLYLNSCLPDLKYVINLVHGICFTVKVKLFLSSESVYAYFDVKPVSFLIGGGRNNVGHGHKQVLKGHSSQWEVHSINLHMYTILVVPSNCAERSLINN